MFEDESNQHAAHSRAIHLTLVAVIGLSFVGFFVGLRQGTPSPDFMPHERTLPAEFADTVHAMTYTEFDRRIYGANREWRSVVVDIDDRPAKPEARWLGPMMRDAYMQERTSRRAFDGAPPTVPHPIEQMSVAECLVCHTEARYLGKNVYAPAMSHEMMPNCTQCHVEQDSAAFDSFLLAKNTFDGIVRADRGFRAWSAAPPRVPHSLLMRENCLSCHGPSGAQAIRPDHPWDAVCLQCHIPATMHDQYARPGVLRRLGILESLLNELEQNESPQNEPEQDER